MTAEEQRLEQARERTAHWKRWGPYLSERAWGTVREDYSTDGKAWEYFPHEMARSRVYRWNEDGLAGISDRHQLICFAIALWNGKDPFLKERLFGLSGADGNHGEDVKECYYYLDSTPTHSYMKYLYKYPQAAFPYAVLLTENRRRDRSQSEYELIDTGIFNEDRYFDVFVEYAKADFDDILIRISIVNRGPEPAELSLLPTIWFRNNWIWGYGKERPALNRQLGFGPGECIHLHHAYYDQYWLYAEGSPELLFTDNVSNCRKLYHSPNDSPYVKDAFHDYVVSGRKNAVNPDGTGTKAAAHYQLKLAPGETATVRLRLRDQQLPVDRHSATGDDFEEVFTLRLQEADEFYATVIPPAINEDARLVMRQSIAGMLWSKQYYHYVIEQWLKGDPAMPAPPAVRKQGRNHTWRHLFNSDVISMPDKWEYPWFAAWDLAFHTIPLALVDSDFAKDQLLLMLREWYMHPNGQLPAYEWNFNDVNPPVHAWACWRVYQMERKRRGEGDWRFLERAFFKLMINFTWWVNRKDAEGLNLFEGGFLGLDNIGVFDRDAMLPGGGFIEQSDGTSWMAMYTLNLLAIAIELAGQDSDYEDIASKFWEHFLYIAHAMNHLGQDPVELWDQTDGFFYDVLHLPDGERIPLKVRSVVGLVPLFAVETLEPDAIAHLSGFQQRMEWFMNHRPDLMANVASMTIPGQGERRLLSIVNADQLRRILKIMLDENEFFSPYGIRALSRYHLDHPYTIKLEGEEHTVDYEPAESTTAMFGGNSNWRGPIWMPMNYLVIESLQKFHWYYGDDYKVECPTGSGKMLTLAEVAVEISHRLSRLFLRDEKGRRPVFGGATKLQEDPYWRDYLLFYEYFHGDNGAGLGASHQTGWTGLIAKLLQQSGELM